MLRTKVQTKFLFDILYNSALLITQYRVLNTHISDNFYTSNVNNEKTERSGEIRQTALCSGLRNILASSVLYLSKLLHRLSASHAVKHNYGQYVNYETNLPNLRKRG